MKDYITNLTKQYLEEAKSSPFLFADMAQMEKYIAESYSSRAIIELVQNADDAGATSILVRYRHGHLYVANNGHEFTEQDISAICRSGASAKKRGDSIGYRGVGFKSTTCFSNNILILSADCCFSFSKGIAAKMLSVYERNVPTVRIPIWVDVKSLDCCIQADVRELRQEGYGTIFIFMNANNDLCKSEIINFDMGSLIFLHNIKEFRVNEPLPTTFFQRKIAKEGEYAHIEIVNKLNENKKRWYLTGDEHGYIAAYPQKEENYSSNNDSTEVFHCYMPTLDSTGFGFRINGDFSTDPSRKHIVADEFTNAELDRIGEHLAEEVISLYTNGDLEKTNLLAGISQFYPVNQFGARIENTICRYLRQNKWLTNGNGVRINTTDAVLLPAWADNALRDRLNNSNEQKERVCFILQGNSTLGRILHKISVPEVDPIVYYNFLSDKNNIIGLSEYTIINLVTIIIQNAHSKGFTDFENIKQLYVINRGDIQQLSTALADESFSETLIKALKEKAEVATVDWFYQQIGVKETVTSPVERILKKRNHIIPRWQTAEQLCIEHEKQLGYRVKDVSKENLGYDVFSESIDGSCRYIEVKSVAHFGESVVITNNEYTTAHMYGDQYYLCIITQGDLPRISYIKNPLENGRLEKRVRVWEWVFSNYVDT